MNIKYVLHNQLDKEKWDVCIRSSINGNIYAWSWYLDAVSPGWDALILNDYEAVMPLTGRKKWGVFYLYRPLLNQQLGVFAKTIDQVTDIDPFIQAIPKKFRLIEITLNKYNQVPDQYQSQAHKSYELDLLPEYGDIRLKYHKNTIRNLKKAEKNQLIIDQNVSAEMYLQLMFQDQSAGSQILTRPRNLKSLHTLMRALKDKKSGRIIGAKDKSGALLAASLFGFSHHKWYYLAPVSTQAGKDQRAQFLIIDSLIRQQAGKPETLDFEGSDIPGVARFYAGYGSQAYPYYFITINRLHLIHRLFKSLFL